MSLVKNLAKQGLLAGAALSAALLAGCGGGAGGNSPPAAAKAPRIAGLGALILDQDTESPAVRVRIDDDDTAAGLLELTAVSSDPSLLPPGGITIEGNGNDRTLKIRPATEGTGSTVVTLTVRDPGGLMGTTSFDVRVNPVFVSFRSLATESFRVPADGPSAKVSGVTVQADADDDPHAFDALLQSGAQ